MVLELAIVKDYCRRVEDLVGVSDIGRMLGLSRQRADQLAATVGFPRPHGKMGRGRVWKRADVERWARKTGRLT